MQYRQDSNGKIITLAPALRLGAGGEAEVFAHPSDSSLVAKIYRSPSLERAQKLTAMLINPPDDPTRAKGHISIAWPTDLVYSANGNKMVVGFLMPRIPKVRTVIDYYNPLTRRRQLPLFNYLYLLQTARNLAAAAHSLHAHSYVIGDVNESNIIVAETSLVTLVDTDSFQVHSSHGAVFRCTVGKPEFTPPELQEKRFSEIDRRAEHDLFGLAVLFFQLLMEGTHPFAGKYKGSDEPPPIEKRIIAGHFTYSLRRRVPYEPMPYAPPFEVIHPKLRTLFVSCFEDGHSSPKVRPTAQVWATALGEAANALTKCSVNEQHVYGNHLTKCPWCVRTQQLQGRDPFPSKQAVQRGLHLQPVMATSPSLKQTPLPPSHNPSPNKSVPSRKSAPSIVSSSPPSSKTNAGINTPSLPVKTGSQLRAFLWLALLLIASTIYFTIIYKKPSATAPPLPPPNTSLDKVAAININLRSSPGRTEPVITTLSQGTEVYVFKDSRNIDGSDWVRIKTKDLSLEGWVNTKNLLSTALSEDATNAAVDIPFLNAKVISLKFFESGVNSLTNNERIYYTRFSNSQARYINWELDLEHPSPRSQIAFTIEAVYYFPDGSMMSSDQKHTYIKSGWTNSYHSFGRGYQEVRQWGLGKYRVALFIDKAKVAEGAFEIF